MQVAVENMPEPLALIYLEHLDALSAELRLAMQAVGANALTRFEESVSRQQDLCTRMGSLAQVPSGLHGRRDPGETTELSQDSALTERIRQASESLQELNRRYAALLKHSGDSLRLFAGLCQSYTAHYQTTGSVRGGATLSCEL